MGQAILDEHNKQNRNIYYAKQSQINIARKIATAGDQAILDDGLSVKYSRIPAQAQEQDPLNLIQINLIHIIRVY